jgi:OFA family oxalate/formate antiporter-like MFS transporter
LTSAAVPAPSPAIRETNRWIQLIAAMIAMMAAANLQYAWTLFTASFVTGLHSTLPAVQVAYSTFLIAATWLGPFGGYLIDWAGPRRILIFAGVLVGLGWVGAAEVTTVAQLIAVYTVGGVGVGIVYAGTVGNAMKWFPDRRGLCVGAIAGAYGSGTALTVAPIASMMKTSGYAHTLQVWGIVQGIAVILAALVMVHPPAGWSPPGWKEKQEATAPKVRTSGVDMTPWQMMRTGCFWLMYLMMVMVAFGGLMVTAQLSPIAKFYGVDKVIVVFGMSALVLAIQVDRILNGLTRPFWGWVSDHLGRENSMTIAFTLEALAVFCLLRLVSHPVWFILFSGLCFFAWGEIFSLFPSITGDLFGEKWATTNYGIVLTAAGVASVFAGPVAAQASVKAGSWVGVFWAMIGCDLAAALMALFWLKPVAARTIARAKAGMAEAQACRASED